MKPFTLFYGASGQLSAHDITSNPQYHLVVVMVNQLRKRLLNDSVLRQPFLHIFSTIYKDDANFPGNLKPHTPVIDQVSNMSKIRTIRHHPPTDNDVVDFLTNSFPDLYLPPGDFCPSVDWGETWSGQGEADKEEIAINAQLVQLLLQAASTRTTDSPARLEFMFMAVFLHELGHSSLVWYGMGACDSPQLDGIAREAGNYVERAFFGGISCAEFELEPMHLVDVGLMKDALFYPIDGKLATELTKLDSSKGLPFLDISTLSPAPPATVGRIRSKFTRTVSSTIQRPVPRKLSATSRIRPILQNDKKTHYA